MRAELLATCLLGISPCGMAPTLMTNDQRWRPMLNTGRSHVTHLQGIRHHSSTASPDAQIWQEARYHFVSNFFYLIVLFIYYSYEIAHYLNLALGSSRQQTEDSAEIQTARLPSPEGRVWSIEGSVDVYTSRWGAALQFGAQTLTAVERKCEFLTLAVLMSAFNGLTVSNVAAHCSAPSPLAIVLRQTDGCKFKSIDQRSNQSINSSIFSKKQQQRSVRSVREIRPTVS